MSNTRAGFSYRRNQMAEQHSPIIEFPTSAVQWAIRPKTKPTVFIDAQCAADGWIAATLAKCSTMRGRYRIRPKVGANKI
jgi:hypothetical protein